MKEAAIPSHAEHKIAEAQAAGDGKGVEYWERIKALVDHAPPLDPMQTVQLRDILLP